MAAASGAMGPARARRARVVAALAAIPTPPSLSSPGTGKSTTASLIADALDMEHIDVGKLVKAQARKREERRRGGWVRRCGALASAPRHGRHD